MDYQGGSGGVIPRVTVTGMGLRVREDVAVVEESGPDGPTSQGPLVTSQGWKGQRMGSPLCSLQKVRSTCFQSS